MRVFSGFPDGKIETIPVPRSLFEELLPQIDGVDELKVTLHLLWLLSQQYGHARFVTRDDLLRDATLRKGLAGSDPSAEQAIEQGLAKALDRRAILAADAPDGTQILVLNTERGRRLMARLSDGEHLPTVRATIPQADDRAERPTVFALYERNIGLLQPMIAEALREAESTYPMEWIEEAIREAVVRNKRSWRYVETILQRWEREGRQDRHGSPEDGTRYVQGRYAYLFQRDESDDNE